MGAACSAAAEATLTTEGAICRRLLLEVCGSVGARLASAASDFLRAGRGNTKRRVLLRTECVAADDLADWSLAEAYSIPQLSDA